MKTPASYVARLNSVLKLCVEVQAEEGYVTAPSLARKLGVTDRMARNYLADLVEVGALTYAGGGRYRLTKEAGRMVEEEELGLGELDVEATALSSGRVDVLEALLERVYRIKKRLGRLGDPAALREKLLDMKAPGIFASDRLIYSSRDLEPRRVSFLVGEASRGLLKNYLLAGSIRLSVAFVCSVATRVKLDEMGQVLYSSYLRRPSLKPFKGNEPFDEGLYELEVEAPELLVAGRKVATRMLAARMKLLNLVDAVGRWGADAYISRGSLLPHGFIPVKSKELERMRGEINELFEALVGVAEEKGLVLASLVGRPRDYRFFEAVSRELGVDGLRVSDAALLSLVLEPWEYTAPMRVESERGRRVEGWYEFYWRVGKRVVKVEYVAREDPLRAQETIVSMLAPNFLVTGEPVGVVEAVRDLDRHLGFVKKAFETALRGVFRG